MYQGLQGFYDLEPAVLLPVMAVQQMFIGGGSTWLAVMNVALIAVVVASAIRAGAARSKQVLLWWLAPFGFVVCALIFCGLTGRSERLHTTWRSHVVMAMFVAQVPWFIWMIARFEGARGFVSAMTVYSTWFTLWAVIVCGLAVSYARP